MSFMPWAAPKACCSGVSSGVICCRRIPPFLGRKTWEEQQTVALVLHTSRLARL